MRKLPYLVAAFAAAVIVMMTFASIVSAAPAEKVGICHATNSDTNPYVYIEVSESAAQAHLDGTHPSHHGQTGDDEDYLADDRSDCEQAEETPTPTPVQSVEPSVQPSVEPTPSATLCPGVEVQIPELTECPSPTSSLIPPVVVINTPTPEPVPNTAIAPEELSDGLAAGTILTLLGGTLLGLATLYLLSNKPYNGKRDE